ncbi:serine threonine kinase [Fusarium pseudoanthophilum]|uniref:Serine threonine kinase n=1 Tax=Fusarium pseudoanthophilum TaxID=48495 RepID=A0A8H5UTM7_9HYPO|nr:serine threonine kinase [Fusarium pseudoanthophilum]
MGAEKETQQQQQNYSSGAAARDTVYSHEGFEKHFEILSKTDFWFIVPERHITRDCVSKSGMAPSNNYDWYETVLNSPILTCPEELMADINRRSSKKNSELIRQGIVQFHALKAGQRRASLRATEYLNLAAKADRDGALVSGLVIAPNATVQSSKQGDQKPEAKIYLPKLLLLWHKSCLSDFEKVINKKMLSRPWLPNGALRIGKTRCKPGLNGQDTLEVMLQVGQAVDYLDGQGLCHTDIKPRNIVVRSWSPINVVLGDCAEDRNSITRRNLLPRHW